MKKLAIILILVLVSVAALSQVAPQKYFIEFMDKTNSLYSINSPAQFLSYRAIERRQKQGIPIIENDIPVNESYINRIRTYNVTVLTRSKWFNGITIYCLNPSIIDSIMRLPFVKRLYKSQFIENLNTSYSDNKFRLEEVLLNVTGQSPVPKKSGYMVNTGYDYGPSFNQIHMLNGDSLHKLGYRGEGMVIAVLDAGFLNVDKLPAFDSLRLNNQILGTKDFVKPGNNVYNEYLHGMEVLSCMGGNIPGQLIGTAPKAAYWLLRSEDATSEYLIEEYNWVSAAEFADSVGADVINSSLGYTEFDEASQNHTCKDMNGNTNPATRGANIAASKGMIVVCSAGNSGQKPWKCISSPADGSGVLAVAAVDASGIRAPFSSVGEAMTRIKPNVAAQGAAAVVSSTTGAIMVNSGTSFSSPIMAGMAACLWQAAPAWSSSLITRSIELSSNQVSKPDSLLGYGIPDFIKALQHLNVDQKEMKNVLHVYPNPFTDGFRVSFNAGSAQDYNATLYNNMGLAVYSVHNKSDRAGYHEFVIPDMAFLPNGNYIL
ncbi:MAG: S8 family serine peptidase, partial [Bacteroidota bacterium]